MILLAPELGGGGVENSLRVCDYMRSLFLRNYKVKIPRLYAIRTDIILHILILAMESDDEEQQTNSSFFDNRIYANEEDFIQAVIECNRKLRVRFVWCQATNGVTEQLAHNMAFSSLYSLPFRRHSALQQSFFCTPVKYPNCQMCLIDIQMRNKLL